VEQEIRRIIPANEVPTILDNIGLPLSGTNMSHNMSGTLGVADADIQVVLDHGHAQTAEYVRRLRAELPEKFPGLMFYVLPSDIVSQILNFGLPAPIDIQIAGRNIEGNRAFAIDMMGKLSRIPGIADPRIQQPADQPKLQITVDRTRAQQAGLNQIDIARNVLIMLSGSFQTSPTFWLNEV